MKMKWMLAVLSVGLLFAAGCASDESDFLASGGDGNPAVHETGAMRFSVQWPPRGEPSPAAIEYGLGELRPIDRLKEFIRAKAENGDEVGPLLNSIFAREAITQQLIHPLTIDPLTKVIHVKLGSGGYVIYADITYPAETVAVFQNIPIGRYLIEPTAWMNDPIVGALMLSYGFAEAEVLPCADPCASPTQATITLASSSVLFTLPIGFVYGSAAPQEIAVEISFVNWPLSFRQASMDIYVTDFPAASYTVFEYLCTSAQVLTDTTTRGCSGTVPATPEIMALLSGSARIIALVDSSSQGMVDPILLLSDTLPDAP